MQIPNIALSYYIITVWKLGAKKSKRAAISFAKKMNLFFVHSDNAGWKAGYLNPVLDMISQNHPFRAKIPVIEDKK